MQSLTQELAAKLRDIVVQEVKEKYRVAVVDVHADASDTLVFTMSFPEANGLSMRVVYCSQSIHNSLNTLPTNRFPDVEFLNRLAIIQISFVLLLDSFANW